MGEQVKAWWAQFIEAMGERVAWAAILGVLYMYVQLQVLTTHVDAIVIERNLRLDRIQAEIEQLMAENARQDQIAKDIAQQLSAASKEMRDGEIARMSTLLDQIRRLNDEVIVTRTKLEAHDERLRQK